VLASWLEFFDRDQRKHAPEQIMWWFLADRLQQAKKLAAQRKISRRETL